MTDAQEPASTSCAGAQGGRDGHKGRGSPKAVQLLLPVWGKPFISQFLEISLPTLLAPGNVPAIAKSLPCKFIFLTSSEDALGLKDHPAINYLKLFCEVEFSDIDDLITGDNYSTTITRAYARAVRAAGAAMLETCFFFMISDYIMADGSLSNVLAKMRAGYSGVVAGNFQVVEEDAKESFFKTFDSGKAEIVILSRDLVRWAINYLHPMTLANMVNFPLCHSLHSNRLFWRVDENTLIGRFYLMHMICIRPEIMDFVVSASCDYSFIPEMCPSGNVHVLTDSDNYLVVEMQKRSHERNFVRLGAINPKTLVSSLAEWATATHRKNAHSAIVFHASDLAPSLDTMIAESEAYIHAIDRSLPPPIPHRNHPYWLGAIAAHRWAVSQRQNRGEPKNFLEAPETGLKGFNGWLFRCRNFIFGRPPHVRPWHPRWPDYRMFKNIARRSFADAAGSVLIISSVSRAYANLLSDLSTSVVTLNLGQFLNLSRDQYKQMTGAFAGCLLVLNETEIGRAHDLIRRIEPLLPRDHVLLIFVVNGHGADIGSWFSVDMLRDVGEFFHQDFPISEMAFVSAGPVISSALRGMQQGFSLVQRSWMWLPIESFVIVILMIVTFVSNLRRCISAEAPDGQVCSSFALVMRKTTTHSVKVDNSIEMPRSERSLWNWRAAYSVEQR